MASFVYPFADSPETLQNSRDELKYTILTYSIFYELRTIYTHVNGILNSLPKATCSNSEF